MLRVGNFIPAISIEGFEEATDGRRGSGTYRHVVRAMQLLKEKHLPFGLSCCYTSQNLDSISDDKFIDQMIEWGADFVWYFHYMPVGNDAVTRSCCRTPEQRRKVYRPRTRNSPRRGRSSPWISRTTREFVGGCIAGGRRYLHINANGDADPCVFIHYSDSNIREKTLLEVLQSPLFMAYHDGQPFNENHAAPVPHAGKPGAATRDDCEDRRTFHRPCSRPKAAEHLCAKCDLYAMNWKPEADRLWAESHPNGAKKSE